MERVIVETKRLNRNKGNAIDLKRNNYNSKKYYNKEITLSKVSKDRGDSVSYKNNKDKIVNKDFRGDCVPLKNNKIDNKEFRVDCVPLKNTKIDNKDFRVDCVPLKNTKIDNKDFYVKSRILNVPSRLSEKRELNVQDCEKKREKDKNGKYDTKSKIKLETKDETNKYRSKARDDVKYTSNESKSNIKMDKVQHTTNKKPLIRTVTDTNDATKVYKDVTFTELRKPQKSIEIKLPNINNIKRKTRIPKLVSRCQRNKIDSKNNVDEKVINKRNSKLDKKIKHRREILSPIRERHSASPTTEIAKWAPNSIDDHTKPYYEAWINTTLSAMCHKKDKLYLEKKKIWKSFQKALEQRSFSPELVYEHIKDERFTGKIRINHR